MSESPASQAVMDDLPEKHFEDLKWCVSTWKQREEFLQHWAELLVLGKLTCSQV